MSDQYQNLDGGMAQVLEKNKARQRRSRWIVRRPSDALLSHSPTITFLSHSLNLRSSFHSSHSSSSSVEASQPGTSSPIETTTIVAVPHRPKSPVTLTPLSILVVTPASLRKILDYTNHFMVSHIPPRVLLCLIVEISLVRWWFVVSLDDPYSDFFLSRECHKGYSSWPRHLACHWTFETHIARLASLPTHRSHPPLRF